MRKSAQSSCFSRSRITSKFVSFALSLASYILLNQNTQKKLTEVTKLRPIGRCFLARAQAFLIYEAFAIIKAGQQCSKI